jgi:riboflavin kinase / FMN adenylyltransferase
MLPTDPDGFNPPALDPSIPRLVVIGNFDGVHLGHQAVLRAAAAEAQKRQLELLVLTFDPHPAEVLGRKAKSVLTRTERKVRLLEATVPGLRVHVRRFDLALADLTPRQFAEQVLLKELGARATVVGENFRFGKGRAGDLATLKALGAELGFEAWAETLHGDAEGPFSSTRIRECLQRGDVRGAARMLGRHHLLSGIVAQGDGRGKTLGFPTANLTDVCQALPAEGVYAVYCFDFSGRVPATLGPGIANLGSRPTVDRPPALEVHLLDFQGDLYGHRLGVTLIDHVRPVEKFPDVAALKTQIEKDIQRARQLLSRDGPSGVPFPP